MAIFLPYLVSFATQWILTTMPQDPNDFFSPAEEAEISAFWKMPGVYTTTDAPWRAILSVQGSTWLFDYYRARGQVGKLIPTQDPTAENPQHKAWDEWIDRKYALDEWKANAEAAAKNNQPESQASPPPSPGEMPVELRTLAGAAPDFVMAVRPKRHAIAFPDLKLQYEDHVAVRRKYAYYRFDEGVMDVGQHAKDLPPTEIQSIFRAAGLSDSDLRVMAAVSLLEGGFDSVNTYDTGYVSVGVIQFASLRAGAGSLGQVLLDYSQTDREGFQKDFRRYGLSVTPRGELVAYDLANGVEAVGPAANLVIIRDVRLISVFGRAGRLSFPFRVSQVRVAQRIYHPGNDPVALTLDGKPVTVKVSDVVRSEAGIATLMDRKVNTGNLGNLVAVVQKLADDRGVKDATGLLALERDVIVQMKYRKDYLASPGLSQPQ